MKRLHAAVLLALLPTLATAHEGGPPHVHPHPDGNYLLVLGLVVGIAALVVLTRRSSDGDGNE